MDATQKSNLISTKEADYLDEDKPIRGQNYALVSFLSPEDVLKDKDTFFFGKFIENFSKDLKTFLETLKERYPNDTEIFDSLYETQSHFFDANQLQEQYKFFKSVHGYDMEKAFHEQNDFRTSIRGIKVRGVFDTVKEAQVRADLLKRQGDKFDIFVAQVGCWCPWSPNPDDLAETEYPESQLNTLMKKYKDNLNLRDEFFELRKNEKIQKAQEKIQKEKEAAAAAVSIPAVTPSITLPVSTTDLENNLQSTDPWTSRKMEESLPSDA